MRESVRVQIRDDHVAGGFAWRKPPACSCGQLADAFRRKFFFVSSFQHHGDNLVYMMPVDANGRFPSPGGVQVSFCPGCGDKISVLKGVASTNGAVEAS
jgi:hypothetical protein